MKEDESFRVFADENLAYVEGEDALEIRSDPSFHLLLNKNGKIPRKGHYEAFEEIQYDKSKFLIIDGPKTTPESEWTCGRKEFAYRSMAEINDLAEMFEKPESAKKNLAVYRPSRLALHEAIVAVSTMVRCTDEEDMRRKVEMIKPKVLSDVKKIEQTLENNRKKLGIEMLHLAGELLKHKSIDGLKYAKIVKNKYNFVINAPKKPAMGTLKATAALAQDEIYTKYASEIISQIARKKVENAIKAGKLKALPIPKREDRIGFMMFGGPGAGKSTSKATFDDMLKDEGLTTSDAVVINTDSYRYLLSDKDTGQLDFSTITYLESAAIRDKVFNRLCTLNEEGKCPHCLLDQIYPSMKAINFSTDNEGSARMEGVARYVVTALWAAKKRGNESKRYVDTVNLLELHKDACQKLPKTLAKNKGKNLYLQIRDNNKLRMNNYDNSPAEIIFEANMLKNTVNILNVEKFYKYILNVAINPKAKDKTDVYDYSKMVSIDEYLKPLIRAGIKVNYPKDYLSPKYFDSQKAAYYARASYENER